MLYGEGRKYRAFFTRHFRSYVCNGKVSQATADADPLMVCYYSIPGPTTWCKFFQSSCCFKFLGSRRLLAAACRRNVVEQAASKAVTNILIPNAAALML